jgi:hypothetical protein
MQHFTIHEGEWFSVELHNPLVLGIVLLGVAVMLTIAKRRRCRNSSTQNRISG